MTIPEFVLAMVAVLAWPVAILFVAWTIKRAPDVPCGAPHPRLDFLHCDLPLGHGGDHADQAWLARGLERLAARKEPVP